MSVMFIYCTLFYAFRRSDNNRITTKTAQGSFGLRSIRMAGITVKKNSFLTRLAHASAEHHQSMECNGPDVVHEKSFRLE